MTSKISIIARHEFTTTLKRRSAQFAIFGLPVLALLIMSGINWFARSQSSADGGNAFTSFVSDSSDPLPVGLVDETGQIILPPTHPLFVAYTNLDAAQTAYAAAEISSYYHIPANYLEKGEIFQYADNVSLEFSGQRLLYTLMAESFIGDEVPLALILNPLQNYKEIDLSATEAQSEQDATTAFGLAMGIAMLFYLTVMGASGYLLQSLGKEKENRVMEILLSSARPFQLLAGKMIGLGGIGLLQMGVWSFLSFFVFRRGSNLFANIPLPTLTIGAWILTILYFIAGYLVYASLFAGLGAIVPNVKEGSQYTFLLMMPALLPMWFNNILITAPNGTFATWLSLIPLTAPISMPMRLALTAVPPWQWLLSLAVSAATAALFLWFATRFFRSQTLLTGQSFTPKVIWKTLRGV